MPARCALLFDGDSAFCDMLRGLLSVAGLGLVVSTDWEDGLGPALDPTIIFIAVELPERAGFALCARARSLARRIPVVVTTATLPAEELSAHQQGDGAADAYLDKRTLTREELIATIEKLIGAQLGQAQPAAAGAPPPARAVPPPEAREAGAERDETEDEEQSDRARELEEEVRRLRWELDETCRAAQSAPFSRDFLRLSEVVASKEKEVMRLRKELRIRDHKIAMSGRTLRELSARAITATRERDQFSGRAAELQRGLETEQSEVRRLRVDVRRHSAEAAQAAASLVDERQQHEKTRQQYELTLAAAEDTYLNALKQVEQDQLVARVSLETQLREEKDGALAAVSAEWKEQLKDLRREHAHSLALLYHELREMQAAHRQELSRRDAEQQAAQRSATGALVAANAEADDQQEALHRQHQQSLGESLAKEAEAHRQREQELLEAQTALETKLREEQEQALEAAAADSEARIEQLRRENAAALAALAEQHGTGLTRATEELTALRAETQRQREELQRIQATAEAEAQAALEELRRKHGRSIDGLRLSFQEQIRGAEVTLQQELAKRDHELDGVQRRATEELIAARAQAAEQDHATRERYELELAQVQARQLETIQALETRLRGEADQALAASGAEWEGKLAALRQEHTAAFEQLRTRYQDQLASLQASGARALAERDALQETALDRAAEELATARAQAAQREDEARERQALELAEVQARHLEALSLLEARLREQRNRTVTAAAGVWERKLSELGRGHAAALDTLRQQHQDQLAALQVARAQELGERDSEHQAALSRATEELDALRLQAAQLEQDMRQRHDRELAERDSRQLENMNLLEARLRKEKEQALGATVSQWEAKLEELRRGHAASLEALRRRHQEQLLELHSAGALELVKREAVHKAALSRAAEQLASARTQGAHLDQQTRERYEQERAQLQARHVEALQLLETKLCEEGSQALAATTQSWEAKLEELSRRHAATLDTLRRQHEEQSAAIQLSHEQALLTKDDEQEAALRRLEEELAAARSQTVQITREARLRTEPGVAQASVRQAEALRALELRLQEEKEQAVAAAIAEWKARLERLRRGHADSVAALRREHQDQLTALEALRPQPASKPRPAEEGNDNKVVPLKAVTGDRSR